jgi:hypothetical protein
LGDTPKTLGRDESLHPLLQVPRKREPMSHGGWPEPKPAVMVHPPTGPPWNAALKKADTF